jgi:CRP-like cAMP-binding protein
MIISDVELFKDINSKTTAIFEASKIIKNYKKGEILFLQEEDAKYFYIIKSGWVKLFRETLDGEEAVIDVITSGHIFGNHAVFDDFKYSYSAEIIEDANIIQLSSQTLFDCIESDQKLALNLIKLISGKQKKNRKEIEHLTIQTAPQRIGCFLLRLCKDTSQKNLTLNLPYDKSLIASRLGMKPETFSRALSKLRQAVNISISGSRVLVADVDGLIKFTCSACTDSFPCKDI